MLPDLNMVDGIAWDSVLVRFPDQRVILIRRSDELKPIVTYLENSTISSLFFPVSIMDEMRLFAKMSG